MELMLLFLEKKGEPRGGPETFAAMKKLAVELAGQGKLRRGAPLVDDSVAAKVRVRGADVSVTDGPFAETKELLGGFWVVDVADRDEAIDIAKRAPHSQDGTVEVHAVRWRAAVDDPGGGIPFLFAFYREPGLTDPDDSKLREMLGFTDELKREGKFIETAPLALDPPPVRVATREGKVIVTDGPFAETKEGIGGYALLRLRGRAEAIEIAKCYPHAKWGPVEVREIMFFDPT